MPTLEDKAGFADASGAVEDERLRNPVTLRVVIKHSLQHWPWDYPPCFLHHRLLSPNLHCVARINSKANLATASALPPACYP